MRISANNRETWMTNPAEENLPMVVKKNGERYKVRMRKPLSGYYDSKLVKTLNVSPCMGVNLYHPGKRNFIIT